MGVKIEFNEEEILSLKDAFQRSTLFSRIISLVVHGSSLYYPLTYEERDSDIDLELILSSVQSEDMEHVRSIVQLSRTRVECQLRYWGEIKQGLIFQSAYKLFMYFAYANGVSLIGKNVYKELINNISEKEVKKSILISAQIAFKDIRKLFLAGSNAYNVNKSIMQTFRLICMFDNLLDYKQLGSADYFQHQNEAFVSIILSKYKIFLEQCEIMALNNFVKYFQSRRFFNKIFPVVNKIIAIFSANLERSLKC
jgi:hypothetical protein